MSESELTIRGGWWRTPLLQRVARLREREDQVFLVLALVIGALIGLTVVAFILVSERLGMRLYPAGGAAWRRVLFPVAGSASVGYLLYRYFSQRTRQRRAADQGCAVCARGVHQPADGGGEVFVHFGDAGQRNPAGTGRALGSSGRGYCIGAGAVSGS
jgi:hypothetical protein